jgi:PAS domain S-box-containing protein
MRDSLQHYYEKPSVDVEATKHKIEAETLRDLEFTQERERYFATLLANLPGMAYRCSNEPGWPMVFASEGALQLTGHPAEDFTKQNPFLYAELIHPEDRMMVWERVQEALVKQVSFTIEYRIIDAHGTEKWVWERGRRVNIPPDSTPVLEGFILDISNRKALERLSEENAKKELELLKARKSESLACLAGAVAHQFNNKFQTIFSCLELADSHLLAMNGEFNPVREEVRASLRAAMDAAQVCKKMTTYLGQSPAEQIRVDVSALCQEIVKRQPIPGRLVEKIAKKPIWTLANPEELRDAIDHLLINAQEANPGGEVKLSLRKTPRDNSREDWACLEVADHGPGVPPQHREQIFDPFFSTKFAGRGLGLAMVLGIVHKIGGEIEVADAPGGGALFRVWLPLVDS